MKNNAGIIWTSIFVAAILAIIGFVMFSGNRDGDSTTTHGEPTVGTDSSERMSDFTLESLDGTKVAYADLTGQPTFIRFSSSTCPICKSENPALISVAGDKSVDARFIEINIAEPRSVVEQYVKDQGLNFEALLDSDGAVTINNKVLGTPTHFVLNPDGSICDRNSTRYTEESLRTIISACS